MKTEGQKDEKGRHFECSVNEPGPMQPLEQLSNEEVLKRVRISAIAVITADGKGLVTVNMQRGHFKDSFAFPFDALVLRSRGMRPRDIKYLKPNDLEALGFAFNGESLGKKTDTESVPYEIRYRIINSATKDAYIITESLENHWQPSHAHKSFIEKYYWTRGSADRRYGFSLVSENADGSITQEQIYQFGPIAWRTVRKFTKVGKLMPKLTKSYWLLGDAVETKAHGIAHNVFLNAGTIIGTSKVLKPDVSLATGEVDWEAKNSFDKTLTTAFAS